MGHGAHLRNDQKLVETQGIQSRGAPLAICLGRIRWGHAQHMRAQLRGAVQRAATPCFIAHLLGPAAGPAATPSPPSFFFRASEVGD
jgi:hypothetical protein